MRRPPPRCAGISQSSSMIIGVIEIHRARSWKPLLHGFILRLPIPEAVGEEIRSDLDAGMARRCSSGAQAPEAQVLQGHARRAGARAPDCLPITFPRSSWEMRYGSPAVGEGPRLQLVARGELHADPGVSAVPAVCGERPRRRRAMRSSLRSAVDDAPDAGRCVSSTAITTKPAYIKALAARASTTTG